MLIHSTYRAHLLEVKHADEFFGLLSWANNCAAVDGTNGIDRRMPPSTGRTVPTKPQPMGVSKPAPDNIGLPEPFQPTLPQLGGSTGVIKSFVLPDNQTGVVSAHSMNSME